MSHRRFHPPETAPDLLRGSTEAMLRGTSNGAIEGQRAATPHVNQRPPSSRLGLLPTLTSSFPLHTANLLVAPAFSGAGEAALPSPSAATAASSTAIEGSPVNLRTRMQGSALKRHPVDVGRLQTAVLVGGSKLAQLQQQRRQQHEEEEEHNHHHHHHQDGSHLRGHGRLSPRSRARFLRQCCTPEVDLGAAKRSAALEALLTAGDYEELFNGGPTVALFDHTAAAGPLVPHTAVTAAESPATTHATPYSLQSIGVDVASELSSFDTRQRKALRQALFEAQKAAEAESGGGGGGGGHRPFLSPKSQAKDTVTRTNWKPTSSSQSDSFAPPQVIQLVFKFGSVRNLPATIALKRIGYPELHEQFSVAASSSGVVYKSQYLAVLNRYLTPHERADALRILDCFAGTGNGHGDVPLPSFLIGLQMLLECATPGDTLRFCFQLLGASSNVPRYMTRYEAQTLVTYADEAAAGDARRSLLKVSSAPEAVEAVERLSVEELVQRCGDKQYLAMRKSMLSIIDDPSRYDYSGRMPLKDFLAALDDQMLGPAAMAAMASTPARSKRQAPSPKAMLSASATTTGLDSHPAVLKRDSPFVFGRVWQGAGTAMVHRMSSKKMIIASLTPSQQQPPAHANSAVFGSSTRVV